MIMLTEKNETLNQFAELLTWIEPLRGTSKDLWLKPISIGKWLLREILTHIMHWDNNSLELMVPNMEEGAQLFFVDIEKHNQEATVVAKSYTTLDVLIDDLIKARQQLLELLKEKYDDTTIFTIDNQNFTYKEFVHVFTHHDAHHIQQVDAFLKQENIA